MDQVQDFFFQVHPDLRDRPPEEVDAFIFLELQPVLGMPVTSGEESLKLWHQYFVLGNPEMKRKWDEYVAATPSFDTSRLKPQYFAERVDFSCKCPPEHACAECRDSGKVLFWNDDHAFIPADVVPFMY